MREPKIIHNPRYASLQPFLTALPERFASGRLLHAGRNEIRAFTSDGQTVVVKRFARLHLLRRIIYSFFRTDKALRSYRNAMELLRRGVSTPAPIGYVAVRHAGLIKSLFYASAETKAIDVKSQLIEKEPWNEPLLQAYAAFVALLHEHGILHRDLNPTNVLYERDGCGHYIFTLIDVNRMTFYDGPVPKDACMENLTLFWWLTPVYRAVLDAYAAQRGWTQADIDRAVSVKQLHDRRWVRRKRLTAFFKRKKKT